MNPFVQFVKDLSDRLGSGFSSLNQNDPSKVAYVRNLERQLRNKDTLVVPFEELSVVVFDLETTGFYPYKGDEILSIGAVKVEGTKILEDQSFYSLVYSESAPSEEITKLTGITGEMLLESPAMRDVLKEFYSYVKTDTLVAHHANHEKQFMNHATWLALRKNFQHRIVDTSFLTKIIHKEKDLVSLDDCCAHYGISIKHRHHAFHDAMATAKLWVESIKDIQELGFENLNDVYTYLATLK
ncbi:exonuclease domain-containing protein [Halobacillus mangrovi]|uniref:DNA polymerase III subunit epsilon n=1 Tax=Halobacillus mangrovi TaxID=402384 RepID=A0A1W6A0E4_9BACI|nr:exonuclease domain-containing protein [Halobacillus mangrovi]ARI78982.1 DNA polymerase III subunit epsilon [Halobacillus mangrovi]